jgi:N6-adenosine-specific RNA methylase IME4
MAKSKGTKEQTRFINITGSWLREHDEHVYLDINRTVSWLYEPDEHTYHD